MKKRLRTIALVFIILSDIILIPANPAASEDEYGFGVLGGIGGPTNAVAVSGNYVYVGKGTSVIVLENTGGTLTQAGQQLNLPSFVSDLKARGKTLYAAAGSAGLFIIDISDPLKPAEKGVYTSSGFAESLVVNDTAVYLANGAEGLQIIDVSDPARPAARGQACKGKYAFGVAVSGNNAYIAAADDGLLTVDISQSAAPKELASLDTPGVARNVAISGKYAFVADDWKGVSAINISNPSTPIYAKTISTAGRAHGLALDGDYLYVADSYMGVRVFDVGNISSPKDITSYIPAESQMMRVVVSGAALYCADRFNGVLCFDIGELPDLKLKGFYSHTIPLPLYLPADIADQDYGKDICRLMVLGIADPYTDGTIRPQEKISRAELAVLLCKTLRLKPTTGGKSGFKDVPSSNKAFGYIEAAVKSGLMKEKMKGFFAPDDYVTNAEAISTVLHIVNLGPESAESYIKSGDKFGMATFVEDTLMQYIRRGNIFAMLSRVIAEIPDAKTGMTVLQSKFGIALQAFPMDSVEVACKGSYAFAVSGTSGFSVIDAVSPANMRQIAHLDFPESIIHIRIYGNYAYLFANYAIYVADISDPARPFRTNTVKTDFYGPPRGMDIDSKKMYIADEAGFHIFSLDNPAKPLFLKFYQLQKNEFGFISSTSDIAVRNGTAYIAMELSGTLIYDVSNVNKINDAGKYSGMENFSDNIQFSGKYAFNKCGDTVDILDLTNLKKPERIGVIGDTSSVQFNYKIGISGNYAILPNDLNGIVITDISNPSDIKIVEAIDTAGIPVNISVEGDKAYVADSLGGMCVVGLSRNKPPAAENTSAQTVSRPVGAIDLENGLFKGFPAERYVLDTEKALALLKSEKTAFSETLIVDNTKDSGKGSLRWCLQNIGQGGRILFDTAVFSPLKPATIRITDSLSFTAGNVTIDASNAGVILDGGTENQTGLSVNTDGNVIKGLKIQNFRWCLLYVTGKSNIIGGSRLKGKGPSGEGNVLVKGGSLMVTGQNATDNIIVGNNVGVDTDGVTSEGTWLGIELMNCSSRTVVGLDRSEYRNVVSGNQDRGIMIRNGSFGNLIEGNYVGTDISGMRAVGNFQHGISFELAGYGSVVRNNITSGNGREGILIFDSGGSFNVLVGNSIGIGANGTIQIPNGGNPVSMAGGVGGGSCYNIFGGKSEELKNRLSRSYEAGDIMSKGLYDTVFDGKVYKYISNENY